MEYSSHEFITGMQMGYIDAISFTECHCDNPLLEDATFSDELHKIADNDCAQFFKDNEKLLRASEQLPSLCGHDFWLTRCGHGAGFWDRGLGEIGEDLTKACEKWSSPHVYLSDDGMVHID